MLPEGSRDKITGVRRSATDKICDINDSANLINNYFNNIGPELDLQIPPANNPHTIKHEVRSLRFEPTITVNLVAEFLSELKPSKPSGCLKLSTNLYIAAFKELLEQLTFIFNLSIRTNEIPKAWKKGSVTPLPKKGDRTLLTNIRPITITHICGKILEKMIAAKLNNHCEINNIFSDSQMGFRKNRSTSMALSELICHINNAQNENNFSMYFYRL